jgi:hypothetical protein
MNINWDNAAKDIADTIDAKILRDIIFEHMANEFGCGLPFQIRNLNYITTRLRLQRFMDSLSDENLNVNYIRENFKHYE